MVWAAVSHATALMRQDHTDWIPMDFIVMSSVQTGSYLKLREKGRMLKSALSFWVAHWNRWRFIFLVRMFQKWRWIPINSLLMKPIGTAYRPSCSPVRMIFLQMVISGFGWSDTLIPGTWNINQSAIPKSMRSNTSSLISMMTFKSG